MILLHRVSPAIPGYLFYGRGYRCPDRYHEGYASERTDTVSHQECARRIFTRMELPEADFNYSTFYCACVHCREQNLANRITHLFMPRIGQNPIVGPDGEAICYDCRAGHHPQPTPRPEEFDHQ